MTRGCCALLFTLTLGACCGPSAEEAAAIDAREQRYAAAERAFARRQNHAALEAFAAVAADPAFDRPTRALARHRQGMLLRRAQRPDEARSTLASVADFGVPERTALAALDAADMASDRASRRSALLDVIRRHPDTGAAEIAVERLAADVTVAEAPAFVATLAELAEQHRDTTLGPVATAWQARLEVEPLGDLPAARRTLRRLTQRWPGSQQTAEALWALAEFEERRGAWTRARETWLALADRHPDRGWIPMGSERGIKADDAALRAARVTLHGIGDARDAIRLYRQAIDGFGDGILGDDMRYELAQALFAAERPAEARAALRDLIEHDPHSRFVPEARAILEGGAPPAVGGGV